MASSIITMQCIMHMDRYELPKDKLLYMNCMKWFYLTLLLVTFMSKGTFAQSNIDSFINTLHNADAISAIAFVAPKKTFDSGKIYGQTVERILTNLKVSPIEKAYPKYLLITKLVQCLNDPERDWYADLLLCGLTELSSINILGCSTRERWLKLKSNMNITYKEADVEMWRKYLAGLSKSDHW